MKVHKLLSRLRSLGQDHFRESGLSNADSLSLDPVLAASPDASPRIVVVGAVVMDFLFKVPSWPRPSEAVQGVFDQTPGGKGLNQAVACAKLSASEVIKVGLISAVADDELGNRLCAVLSEYDGIEMRITRVKPDVHIHTDVTAVLIADGLPGYIGCRAVSNALSAELVEQHASIIAGADIVCITCDIPLDAARAAIRIAMNARKQIIVNAAPPPETETNLDFVDGVDFLVLNDWEARRWLHWAGHLPNSSVGPATREALSNQLALYGPLTVIITSGSRGCLVRSANPAENIERLRAFRVDEVDMSGASDAFCAALAVGSLEQMYHPDRLRFASAAAALACTVEGAYTSMPTRSAVDEFLRERDDELLVRTKAQLSMDSTNAKNT